MARLNEMMDSTMQLPMSGIGLLLVFGLVYTFHHIWYKVFSLQGLPPNIPWLGSGNSVLSRGRTTLKSFVATRELIETGYEKYSKHGEMFILPNLLVGPEVILPPSQMQWLLDQPDDVLDTDIINVQTISADRTMLDKRIMTGRIHKDIIQRELTREQDSYTKAMNEEIDYAQWLCLGHDTTEWRKITPFDMWNDIVTRVVARVFVGLPLCRDDEYLKSSHAFNKTVPLVAAVDNLTPPLFRPLVMLFATAYDKFHARKVANMIVPFIKQRLSTNGMTVEDPNKLQTKGKTAPPANDYAQWAIRYASSGLDPIEQTPEMMTKRLTVLNFAAIHSTALTISNVVLDIACHHASQEVQSSLRQEIIDVQSRFKGKEWTRAALSQMIRLDSAIRESIRLWGFSSRGVSKQVVAPKGIQLPDGTQLPFGCKVGITTWGVHHDETFYHKASTYDPFRFSDEHNAAEIEGLYQGDDKPKGPSSMVSTGEYYLGFSHGRHSCPGRFFVAHHLKCQIAQLILKYEFRSISERSQNMWFNNLIGPAMDADGQWSRIHIRRRGEQRDLPRSAIS